MTLHIGIDMQSTKGAADRKILVAAFCVLACNELYQAGRSARLNPGKPEVDTGRS